MLNLKTLLGIDDLTEFNIKLDNIDQFGIDTNTLFALNHDRLLQEIGFFMTATEKEKHQVSIMLWIGSILFILFLMI